MGDFKERIVSFIRDYLKISVRKFEETCGLTNGTIGSIKEQGPTALALSKIAYAYPELNMNWLLCGKGQMLVKDAPNEEGQVLVQNKFNVENVQAVFVTNWLDIRAVVEDAVKSTLISKSHE